MDRGTWEATLPHAQKGSEHCIQACGRTHAPLQNTGPCSTLHHRCFNHYLVNAQGAHCTAKACPCASKRVHAASPMRVHANGCVQHSYCCPCDQRIRHDANASRLPASCTHWVHSDLLQPTSTPSTTTSWSSLACTMTGGCSGAGWDERRGRRGGLSRAAQRMGKGGSEPAWHRASKGTAAVTSPCPLAST